MSHPEPDHAEARRLWARIAESLPPPGACLPPGDLAAYADRRLAADEHASVEAHLAACADCLAAVRGARAILAEAPGRVPPAVLAAARSLVPAPSIASRSSAARSTASEPSFGWRISEWLAAGRWVAATAASIVICLVGYRAGTMSFVNDGAAGEQLAANMSFGVFDDPDADADLDLLAGSADWDETEVTP